MFRDVQDPPVYAIVERDQQVITSGAPSRPKPIRTNTGTNCSTRTCSWKMPTHFMASTRRKASNSRGVANMPWHSREFVVKDCDGRLLAFGANL